jgi:xylose isomerase
MIKTEYRFCAGPWNFSEGRDPYGPETRPAQSFPWKLAALKKLGFAAMMFHDDDAVPEIDSKSHAQVLKEAKALRHQLDGEGIVAEIVAPRLWFSPRTVDGGYTSNRKADRQYALDRSKQTIDIARELGTNLIVLWLAREGTYLRNGKFFRGKSRSN